MADNVPLSGEPRWLLTLFGIAINGILNGRTNNAGSFTVTASTTTTVVTDRRVGATSVINWMPKTDNAAVEIGTLYVSARDTGQFTVTHSNNGQTDRDFDYTVTG